MMKWVFGALIILSVIFGIGTGRIEEVTNAALSEGVNAIQLFLYMLGGICVWGGIMRIADKSGITTILSNLFKPLLRLIFGNKINTNGMAFKAMCMNITANLLGLGNAATPLGMEAMHHLEEDSDNPHTDEASNSMIIFVMLNTASITLIPTTAASLRLKHGSVEPLSIMPMVLITSLASVSVSLILAKVLNNVKRRDKK